MITITISGFKTMEEAQSWVDAYSGGVEQDMSIWAEAKEGKYSLLIKNKYFNRLQLERNY